MAFRLVHITDINVLKSINPPALKELFFLSAGFNAPLLDDGSVDFRKMCDLLTEPERIPPEIANALFYIDALSTPSGADALQEQAEASGLSIPCAGKEVSPADYVLQVWLEHPDLVKRALAESSVENIQATESFYGRDITGSAAISRQKLKAVEKAMDRWFTAKRRGTGTEISHFKKDGAQWFVIRRGDAFRRETLINQRTKDSDASFGYPEIHDILIYDHGFNELRIRAKGVNIKKEYRRVFGLELFGDPDYFMPGRKFTLNPLLERKEASLNCGGIPGLLGARLTRIEYPLRTHRNEVVSHVSDDVLASFAERESLPGTDSIPLWASIPALSSATIRLHIGECDGLRIGERSVKIIPPNRALYKRDAALPVIERFLIRNGFILQRPGAADAEVRA
jgi:hypothetical protein